MLNDRILNRLFLALCSFSVCSLVHAQGVYEGFTDYADSASILSSNGGDGFQNNWQPRNVLLSGGAGVPSADSVQLLPSSLAFTDSAGNQLQTAGGSLFLTGEFGSTHIARTYDESAFPITDFPPLPGQTTYISFLARRSGEAADPNDPVFGGSYPWGDNLYPRVAGVNFWSNDGGDAVPLHIGNISNTDQDVWHLHGQDLDNNPPTIDEPFGAGANTYLVVFRVDHSAGDGGGDTLSMYLNPLLESEAMNTPGIVANWEKDDDPLHLPGSWLSVEVGDGSGNRPYAEFSFDEFRIGGSWAEVTPFVPVPEPGTICLAGMMLGLMGIRRRRV